MNYELIWICLLAFVIIMYVILDGFDIGVGISFLLDKDEKHRTLMMNSVLPVWDGNATWLVLGAATMYGAFPKAYATLLPSFYIPIILMLAALIFRGVAFEFRYKAVKFKRFWNNAFGYGSLSIALMQGIILGTYIQGYETPIHDFKVEPYYWITPFSILTGIMLANGYLLLGSTWLILKTEGRLQALSRKRAKSSLFFVAVSVGIVSLWTPYIDPVIYQRWFSLPNFFYLSPLPILTLVLTYLLYLSLDKKCERRPFIYTICIFMLSFIGICISLWPYIIPRVLTFTEAAAPIGTLKFILVGMVILMPVLIWYTAHTYKVFGGKVQDEMHY